MCTLLSIRELVFLPPFCRILRVESGETKSSGWDKVEFSPEDRIRIDTMRAGCKREALPLLQWRNQTCVSIIELFRPLTPSPPLRPIEAYQVALPSLFLEGPVEVRSFLVERPVDAPSPFNEPEMPSPLDEPTVNYSSLTRVSARPTLAKWYPHPISPHTLDDSGKTIRRTSSWSRDLRGQTIFYLISFLPQIESWDCRVFGMKPFTPRVRIQSRMSYLRVGEWPFKLVANVRSHWRAGIVVRVIESLM
jgi:hypothetical protein